MHAVFVALAVLGGVLGLLLANLLVSALLWSIDDPGRQTRGPSDREV